MPAARKKQPVKKPASKGKTTPRKPRAPKSGAASAAKAVSAKAGAPREDKFGDKAWQESKKTPPADAADRAAAIEKDKDTPGGVRPPTRDEQRLAERRDLMRREREAHAEFTAGKQPGDHLVAHRFKPGQSGNPKGRPKGARAKLSEDFLQAMHDAFEVHGRGAIEDMIADDPAEFVKACVKLQPKQVEHSLSPIEEMTDEDLDDAIARGIAQLGVESRLADDDRGKETAH